MVCFFCGEEGRNDFYAGGDCLSRDDAFPSWGFGGVEILLSEWGLLVVGMLFA